MPIKPDLSVVVPEDLGRVHFIGIGGSGMSGIAHLFLDAGVVVTGSDRSDGPYLEALRARGAAIHVGHAAENVGDADTIVFTSAIWPDNPEYRLAQQRGLILLHRSQALHWISRSRRVVSVAGAHGKTTTTGMIVTILRELGTDPSYVNGGFITGLQASSATGTGDLFVLEADESDGSFLLYDTAVAVITNVDPVHLDHYGDDAGYLRAFRDYAAGADEFVVAGEGQLVDRVLADLDGPRIVRVGFGMGADARVADVESSAAIAFDLTWRGTTYRVEVPVPGSHNALNAAAALATVAELGYPMDAAVAALGRFRGTKRRFEAKGRVRGVAVYDDYAHEPAEVAATLAAARSIAGSGRVIAIHQPHLYSRTQRFAREFAQAYENGADYTIVLAVDGAREDPVPGVSGQLVVDHYGDPSRVALIEDWQEAAEHLATVARAGDLVLTMSCGTVYQIVPQLLDALARTPEPSR